MAARESPAPEDRPQDDWHPARLIPVAGIRGQEEQERRATSALLAVIGAVPDFGHALLHDLGAPRGRIRTFAEIRLHDSSGNVSIPDGAIVVERGQTRWSALVEVKTGAAFLGPEQVNRYLEMTRDHGFDCLITISNQITGGPTELPVDVDRRRTRRIGLFHLSWWRIITEAILQHRHRKIADPDQAWILGELIAYLDHENSGASGFEDMGEAWVQVRDGARHGILRAADPETRAVAERWEHFLDYLALGLTQDLGREVEPVRARRQTTDERLAVLMAELVAAGVLQGALRIPDAVAPLTVLADLRARQVTTSVKVDAPQDRRALARVRWMLRQVEAAAVDLRLEVAFAGVRDTTSLLLGEAREHPQRLLHPGDPRRDPRSFTIAMNRAMGYKRGKGQGSFVRETRRQVLDFYGDIVQHLKPWQAKPPRLPEPPPEIPEDARAEPPPFVVADEREVGEATLPPA